jgi:hypothetical protein
MQTNGRRDLIIDSFLLLMAGLVLCVFAFVNGFPLVYSDTGTYINSGFENEVPIDRPILYGLFLRHISLKTTLWLPVYFQALMTAWSIRFLINRLDWTVSFRRKVFAVSILLLTACTGIAQKTGNLLPDFTTALIPIVAVGMLVATSLTRGSNLYIGLISVILITAASLLVRRIARFKGTINLPVLWKGIGIAFLLMLALNFAFTRSFFVSRNGSVFMTGHLADCGLLDEFLNEECPQKKYILCEWSGAFSRVDFLWDAEASPHYKTGGWENNQGRYNEMLIDFFTTPKYLGKYVTSTISLGVKQIFDYGIYADMENIAMREGSAPHGQITWRFPRELPAFVAAKQYKGKLDYSVTNTLQNVMVVLSCILIVVGMYLLRKASSDYTKLKILVWFVLTAIIVNGFVCAGLTISNPRFGSRVIWLLPFAAILITAEIIRQRKRPGTQ